MRPKRNFTRKSGTRDSRLIIIATEGECTEKSYFNGVAYSSLYRRSGVHVEVLKRETGGSDPKNCLLTLNKFKSEYHLNKNDELWLVCDVDRWGAKKLSEVSQLCRQKGYRLSVSNPCFELWLLIHHVKVSQESQEYRSEISSACARVGEKLRSVLNTYNKSNLNIDVFIENIEHAILEGTALDKPNEDWPNSIGSKVFHLVKSIIGK